MHRITRTLLLPLIVTGCATIQTAGRRGSGSAAPHTRAALVSAIDSMPFGSQFGSPLWPSFRPTQLLERSCPDRVASPILVVEVPPLRLIDRETLRFHRMTKEVAVPAL